MNNSEQATKKEPTQRKPQDMDTAMLFGCTGFVSASLGTYLLTVWPHVVFTQIYSLTSLGLGALLGMFPTLILGGFITRKFGLPGAAGFLGGSMASAVFFYLRIRQALLFRGVPQAPQPEYPDLFAWLLPVGWIVATLIVIFLMIKREEITIDPHPRA